MAKVLSDCLSSICYIENHICLVSYTGILRYSFPGLNFEEILSKQGTELHAEQVRSRSKHILLLEHDVKTVFAYEIFTEHLKTFGKCK